MSKIKIAVTADWHLRDMQYSRRERGQDFYKGVLACCDKLIEYKDSYDIAVVLGDNFHVSRPTPAVIKQLISIDKKLQAGGVRALIITGNHDWHETRWVDVLFSEEDKEFGLIPFDETTTDVNGVTLGSLRPMSRKVYKDADKPDVDVFLHHCLVSDFMDFQKESDYTIDDFGDRHSAVLLGDIHVNKWLENSHGTLVGYPGSTEMGSTSELASKSFTIVEAYSGGKKAKVVDTVNFATRPYITGSIKTEEDFESLLEKIKDPAFAGAVINVKYDVNGVHEFLKRLYLAADSDDFLVRHVALPRDSAERIAATRDRHEDDVTVQQFADSRFADNQALADIAGQIIDKPDFNVIPSLDAYVTARRKELEDK